MSSNKAPLFIIIIGWLTLIDSVILLLAISGVFLAPQLIPHSEYVRVALNFASGIIGILMAIGLLNMQRWAAYGAVSITLLDFILSAFVQMPDLGPFGQIISVVVTIIRLVIVVGILIYHNQMKPASGGVYAGVLAFTIVALIAPVAIAITMGGEVAIKGITEPSKIVTVESYSNGVHTIVEQRVAGDEPQKPVVPDRPQLTPAQEQLLKQHYTLALDLQKQGRFSEAIAEYGQVLSIDPDKPAALYGRGICMVNVGQASHLKQYMNMGLNDFKRAGEIFNHRGDSDDEKKCNEAVSKVMSQIDRF